MSSEEWQIIGFTTWVSACSTVLILPLWPGHGVAASAEGLAGKITG